MNIAETGFWSGNTEAHHKFDVGLSNALVEVFKDCSVIDLGCGEGKYVRKFRENGLIAQGIDGNPETDNIEHCSTFDLTKPMAIRHYPDATLCLEVGEHIPFELCDLFIENIKRLNSTLIVISWAIPGQGGDGHVNELPNEAVKEMFKEYKFDEKTSQHLRNSADLWWFKNTIMVFRKV